MKLISHFKFPFTYEAYRMVITGDTVDYVKYREDNGLMLSGQAGTVVLVTKDSLNIGDAVRNLRDAKGNEILVANGESYQMFVNEATPQVDANGLLVGWRQTLRRTQARDFEKAILDLTQSALS